LSRIQSGNEGRALNNQADYTGSVFGNYNLPSGFLKRTSVGGGVVVIGRRIIGNQVGNAFDYIKAPAYYTMSLTAAHSAKLFRKNVRFQLNVNNLLDYDLPVYTSVGTRNAKNYRNGFYYIEPRKFVLSATLDLERRPAILSAAKNPLRLTRRFSGCESPAPRRRSGP
jgi:outer membrane receptor for monomeric catechols